MASHSSILAWRPPWIGQEPGGLSPWGHQESGRTEPLSPAWHIRIVHVRLFFSRLSPV